MQRATGRWNRFVNTRQVPEARICGRLLTELSQAKLVLLDDEQRNAYDAALRSAFEQSDEIAGELLPGKLTDVAVTTNDQATAGPAVSSPATTPARKQSDLAEAALAEAADLPAEIHLHFNFRNAVIFVAVSLVVMLATVLTAPWWMGDGPESTADVARIPAPPPDLLGEREPDSDLTPPAKAASPAWDGTLVVQNANAEILLTPADASMLSESLKRTSTGITGWSSPADTCSWMINVADRRTSFFHCDIRYQSRQECRMKIQIGEQKARPFSIYAHDESFTERFFVRLGADRQRVTITVVEVDPTAELNLQQIKLTPTK